MEESMKLGIDLGSRFVKLIYGQDITKYNKQKFDTISFYKKYGEHISDKYQINLPLLYNDLIGKKGAFSKITATGYGRNVIAIEGFDKISELKAHFLGAKYQIKKDNMLIIDIGGQDTKVIGVKNGQMQDFEINDNCAASTGRYLENMSKALDISLDELSQHYENPTELSSTCVVFGESELIGKIAQGVSLEKLCAGINYSIVKRIVPMVQRFEAKNICMVGGVADNTALRILLEKELGQEIQVPQETSFNGALGAYSVNLNM